MTELYPLLTIQNVKYWYWEVEPHWSTVDIAKNVGCSTTIVLNFMEKNKIPRRSRANANINRFNCPHKYKAFIKQRQTEGFRTSQSLIAHEVMQEPRVRKNYLQAIKTSNKGILSKYQKLILFLLVEHKALFITEFLQMIDGSLETIDSSLRSLYNRGFVDRGREFNPNTLSTYKTHYKYSITEEGERLIINKLKNNNHEFMKLLKNQVSEKKDKKTLQQEFIQRENIGKNQLRILKAFQNDGSQFLLDLVPKLGLSKNAVDCSLRCLSSRGFLTKEKKLNPNYQGKDKQRKQYLYSLTAKCPILI